MGDTRFTPAYDRIAAARDPSEEIRRMSDEDVVSALAAASRSQAPFLANVLATEAQNRMRRTRAALEHLGEGVCSVDVEERVTFLNPAAARMLGWREGEVVGRSLHGSAHGSDSDGRLLPDGRCTLAEAMRSRRVLRCETETFARGDGSTFPVAYTAAPLVRDGEVEGAVIVFSDATERRAQERELRESEARWHALSDAAFEGIILHEGGRILDANRAAHALLGLPPDSARGRDVLEFVAPASREAVVEAIRAGREAPYEVECLRPDGTTFRAEVMGRAVPYRGRVARVAAVRALRADPPTP